MRNIVVGRILGYRFGSSTSFKLQQTEKRWSNYLCHLFLNKIAFLACPGNPFFAPFARSVLQGVCALHSCKRLLLAESWVTGSGHPPPLSCNKWRKMVQLSLPLVFTRNSILGVPRKSFLRGVCALRSCERLLLAESLVTGSTDRKSVV